MRRRLAVLFVPALFLIAGTQARANYVFTTTMLNSLEPNVVLTNSVTGAPRTSGGTVIFSYNDSFTSLSFTATVFGIDLTATAGRPASGTPQSADLNDDLTNAHIHASDTLVPGTQNTAPVVWGFFGAPLNDNNPNNVVVTPTSGGLGGTISGRWDPPEGNGTTLAAQIQNLLAGRAYINFHTTQNSGGEFRAFLTPIPEPASFVLLGIGTTAVIACGWRGRKR